MKTNRVFHLDERSLRNPRVLQDRLVGALVWLVRWMFIVAISYLFLYPILFFVCTAIQDPSSVSDPSVILIPKKLSMASIVDMIEILHYGESAFLTLEIAVLSTVASLISCSLVGYSLARFNYWGKNLLFALVVLTIVVPPSTILPNLALNFRFFDFGGLLSLLPVEEPYINLLNSVWTYVLPSLFATGLRSGVFIFIFRQFFLGQPKELEEAARIDGCGALKTYVRVIVPLATPAFVTVMLFSFIWHWNDYCYAASLFTNEVKPLMALLNDLDALLSSSYLGVSDYAARTYKAAAVLLTILPPLLLYVFAQKYFTESIERAGIVG